MNKIFRFCYSFSNYSVARREEKIIESGDSSNIEERNMGLRLKETFYLSHGAHALYVNSACS